MSKKRLDVLLFERGLSESRQRAQADIMGGWVYVDGQQVLKAGTSVSEEAAIEVRGQAIPYVSRGGLKLAKAMEVFGLDLTGMVCADIGASTGGFTDCMLQHGAAKVYAVDTGTHDSLMDASQFIHTIEKRQGMKVACLEEIGYRNKWLSAEGVATQAERLKKTEYGAYLKRLLNER